MSPRHLACFLLLLSGCSAFRSSTPPTPDGAPRVLRASAHGLINPILDIEPTVEFRELRPFKHKLEHLVDDAKLSGRASHVSIYFRDLENGPLFGMNERELFSPASLLKVPLLIAAMRRASREPGLLDLRLRYQAEDIVDATIREKVLDANREYSLDELLRAMIANSDNNAAVLVRRAVGPAVMDEVYRDLGIAIPKVRGPGDSMAVREYATFFRILYNAAYIDKDRSQKALEYLAASEFKAGIVAGVPSGITVAHKYGERAFSDSPIRQLHDCGIVYFKPEPYLLCVMTRGTDNSTLAGVIRDISRLVYDEVSAQQVSAKP